MELEIAVRHAEPSDLGMQVLSIPQIVARFFFVPLNSNLHRVGLEDDGCGPVSFSVFIYFFFFVLMRGMRSTTSTPFGNNQNNIIYK